MGIEVYENVSRSGPYNVTTSKLQITPAQKEQNGKVQCLVWTNTEIDLPNDNETVELLVLGKLVGLCTGTRAKHAHKQCSNLRTFILPPLPAVV